MPLIQSIKDQISTEFGVPFNEVNELSRPCENPTYSSRLMKRMFPEKVALRVNKSVPLSGRGYVKIGEGVSAKEVDQRNMEILNRW